MSNKKFRNNNNRPVRYNEQKNSAGCFIVGTIVTVGLVVLFMASAGGTTSSAQGQSGDSSVVSISGDNQIIEVTVAGGYSPRQINAKANTPTILRMNSKSAYGCERAFGIYKLGISQTLPQDGITDINIGAQAPGTKLTGSCSMGMYTFTMTFN